MNICIYIYKERERKGEREGEKERETEREKGTDLVLLASARRMVQRRRTCGASPFSQHLTLEPFYHPPAAWCIVAPVPHFQRSGFHAGVFEGVVKSHFLLKAVVFKSHKRVLTRC